VVLREARCRFTYCLMLLLKHMFDMGYEVALDEVTERLTEKDPTSDHMPQSLHHIGLAADINLYDRQGRWLKHTEDHRSFGEWWEQLGRDLKLPLAWGGHFGDGNHYSLSWGGRK